MGSSSQDFKPFQSFDIEEVEASANDEEGSILNEGAIEEWKHLEIEKAKARPYITSTVLLLWVVCTVVGLIIWTTTGNIAPLVSSPVLFTKPLLDILKFYYK